MEVLVILVPLALGLGLAGLLGFLWSLKSGQYDDLDGAGWRAIADDEPVSVNREGSAGSVTMARRPEASSLNASKLRHDLSDIAGNRSMGA